MIWKELGMLVEIEPGNLGNRWISFGRGVLLLAVVGLVSLCFTGEWWRLIIVSFLIEELKIMSRNSQRSTTKFQNERNRGMGIRG